MRRRVRAARLGLAFLALAAVSLAGIHAARPDVLGIMRLPAPTGPAAVGTTILTVAPGVSVQVWYPAQRGSAGQRAPYALGSTAGNWRARLSAAMVRTDAVVDVPVAPGRYPILLYAPSWGGVRSDNTTHAQNLASHGFIVVAMDDAYAAIPMDLSSATAYHATLRWAGRKARLAAAKASRILDAFERLSAPGAPSRFAGHADMRRVGMYGFSFGGAVAAQAATRDPRIRAVVDLDGWIFADAAARGVNRPFLVVTSSAADEQAARAADGGDQRYADLLDADNVRAMQNGLRRYGGFWLTVSGTNHYNFADVAVLPSFRHTGVGPIDGRRAQAIVGAYLLAFFDRFLNARAAPLLEAQVSARSTAGREFDSAARLQIWPAQNARIHPSTRSRRAAYREGDHAHAG